MALFATVFYDWSRIVASYFGWAGPLAVRIVVGWVFLWTGWQKLHFLPQMIDNFRSWGIPAPEILTLQEMSKGKAGVIAASVAAVGAGAYLLSRPNQQRTAQSLDMGAEQQR